MIFSQSRKVVFWMNCVLPLSEEFMTMKSLKKINAKLQILYGQNEFLSRELCRL